MAVGIAGAIFALAIGLVAGLRQELHPGGAGTGKVRIDVGDQVCEVPVEDVEKANLVYEF